MKPRKADKAAISPASQLMTQRGRFVRVAGEPTGFAIERERNPERIDHLWISVRAGRFGVLRITLNTSSLRNRDLGFDSRVFVGILQSHWSQLPAADVAISEALDYETITASHAVRFHPYERTALETLIAEMVARAVFVEGWGELYLRGHPGIHQVHSRRASHAFKRDHIGRDGAVQFYFDGGNAEKLLFKFFGQP